MYNKNQSTRENVYLCHCLAAKYRKYASFISGYWNWMGYHCNKTYYQENIQMHTIPKQKPLAKC